MAFIAFRQKFVQRKFTCLDDCDIEKNNLTFSEGARLEARLTGFKGGQGILELWQKRGKRPQIMIIMTGLEENKNYHAIFVPMDSNNAKSCFRRGLSKEEAEGEKLISIVADHTGMAVMPWTPIDFHVLSDDIVGKQVLIVEEGSQQIVDCGRLEVKGNHSTWLQEISNSTGMSIAIGVEEHAHALPYFLGWLENIEYPKSRINLQFFLNSNEDSSSEQLKWWKDSVKNLFHAISFEKESDNWLETALRSARLKKSGKILLITPDFIISDKTFIQHLGSVPNHVVVVPVVRGIRGKFANVDNVDEEFIEELQTERFINDEVFLPLFVNLTAMDSSYLTFDSGNLLSYVGASDPTEVFTVSASRMKIPIYLDHARYYGFYIKSDMEIEDKRRLLRYSVADLLADGYPTPIISRTVRPWVSESEKWGVNEIYLINLKRRPEKLERMLKIFELLGVDFKYWEAVDGWRLEDVPEMKEIKQLPSYLDPFHKRPMKTGEIGCFLSHYRIWKDVVQRKLSRVIVFEDDLRFASFGLERIKELLEDLDASLLPWDLIYLGRKKNSEKEETWVRNHRHLSTAEYSYWTLGYMLSLEGARKLIDANPLSKLVPVDEYLPIMADKHPNEEWSSHFQPRNLRMYTLYPLSVEPQKYTTDPDYVSDTEDSTIIQSGQDSHKRDEL
ncbi:hypothetical protein WR25_14169 [Diploscapter pachys]|uniref:Glycosyl transferase family 25 domain-containing protein n=1 Tax=Diploscapter pachys TaxID=2018661 RepID=A0A2A2LL15_9BILA|nr:hypothetical protein WR25_14169 [Diploscapter pachys]